MRIECNRRIKTFTLKKHHEQKDREMTVLCIIHFIIREDVNMEGEGEMWSHGQRQQALK